MNNVLASSRANTEMREADFRDSFRQLAGWTRSQAIAEKSIGRSLDVAEFYGILRWFNADGTYEDTGFENIIADKVLRDQSLRLPDFKRTDDDTILIATHLHDYGGHSRVVLNWMKAFNAEGNHKLLITRGASRGARQVLLGQDIPYRLCTGRGIELINEILAYCANVTRIVLHISPSDIITTAAAHILKQSGKSVIFYNHADHVFSFGISNADVVCEVSSFGAGLNMRTHRTNVSAFLGIPIDLDSNGPHSVGPSETEQGKTILSGGESYKYAPGEVSFSELIDRVLRVRGDVSFVLMGPTGREPWWAGTKERWGNRVRFPGKAQSYSRYLDALAKADVYVDSFPVCGGTAFPEALLRGKLVTGMVTPIQGYSPADALRVADVSAAAEEVIRLLDRDAQSVNRVEEVRGRTIDVHSMTRFRERVINAYAGIYDRTPGLAEDSGLNWFERRWEANRVVSLPGLFYSLPLSFCLAFLSKFSQLFGHTQPQGRVYLWRRIFVAPLTNFLRANFKKA